MFPQLVLLRSHISLPDLIKKGYILVQNNMYHKIYIERHLKNNQNVVLCKKISSDCVHENISEYSNFNCRYVLKINN